MTSGTPRRPYHVAFADTCVGGSTVASRLAVGRTGLRGFYLADYAVNPLGVKPREEVRAALEAWVDVASSRAPTLIVACNTASVLLRDTPEVLDRARRLGLEVHSMADFLEALLRHSAPGIHGKQVCLMGTEFTVSQPFYGNLLTGAGASTVLPLPATRTERTVAHLEHGTSEGRRIILEEIRDTVGGAEAVVLACTCFPLAGDLIREANPDVVLLDPGEGAGTLEVKGEGGGPNLLTVALTGDVLSPEILREQAPVLFPGWELESVLRL